MFLVMLVYKEHHKLVQQPTHCTPLYAHNYCITHSSLKKKTPLQHLKAVLYYLGISIKAEVHDPVLRDPLPVQIFVPVLFHLLRGLIMNVCPYNSTCYNAAECMNCTLVRGNALQNPRRLHVTIKNLLQTSQCPDVWSYKRTNLHDQHINVLVGLGDMMI